MAFNGSGVHNRVHDWTQDLSNTVPVTASRMDAEHDDISSSLSNTICRDGQSTTTARIPFASGVSSTAGSTSSVAYAQTNDANTGLYFPASDQVGLVAGGTEVVTITSSGISIAGTLTPSGQLLAATGTVGAPGISFSADADCGLYRIGANNIGAAVNGAKVLDIGTVGLSITGTLASSGALTVSANGAAITGNSTVTGTFGVSGNFAINTDKFTVVAASGNTAVAGSLAVAGAGTFSSTLGVTGATTLSSTLAVTGASTFTGGGKIPLLHIQDQKPSGTAAQTLTEEAWNTRELTQEVTDEIGSTLSSNTFTLPAGTYWAEIESGFYARGINRTWLGRLRLYNTTDAADTNLYGITTGGITGAAENLGDATIVTLKGRLTLAGTKTMRVEMYARGDGGVLTFCVGGIAMGQGIEVYTDAKIWKIA